MTEADWHRRVVDRSLRAARQRSIDRGAALVRAAGRLLEKSNGDGFTVQDVAEEAGQSLRTLYQYFESKDDLLLAVFEEAMVGYAELIRRAIVDLEEPVERLAGALLAAGRLPSTSHAGVKGGLSRLRLKVSEVEPELVGRSQAAVTSLFRDLVAEAAPDVDADAATFLLLAANTAAIHSDTLGNSNGGRAPDVRTLVEFGLRGLGVRSDPAWLDGVEARLRIPQRRRAQRRPA